MNLLKNIVTINLLIATLHTSSFGSSMSRIVSDLETFEISITHPTTIKEEITEFTDVPSQKEQPLQNIPQLPSDIVRYLFSLVMPSKYSSFNDDINEKYKEFQKKYEINK